MSWKIRHWAVGSVLLLWVVAVWADEGIYYGRKSLQGLRLYGLAVKVQTTGVLKQHEDVLRRHIEGRLASRNLQVHPEGSVTLRLVVHSIHSDDGFVVVHLALYLAQSSYLGSNNKLVDAITWDAWKMGEYREEDILGEVDDLARQFMNDYIAAN